jgi:hypothetical protein
MFEKTDASKTMRGVKLEYDVLLIVQIKVVCAYQRILKTTHIIGIGTVLPLEKVFELFHIVSVPIDAMLASTINATIVLDINMVHKQLDEIDSFIVAVIQVTNWCGRD